MSYRKYLEDYRIEEYTDGDSGRVRTRAVYKGDLYTIEPEIPGPRKKALTAASAVSWAAYIGALALDNKAAHLTYVILPFALTAFPLIFTTMATVALHRAKALMTREDADKTAGRLPISSFFAALLPAGSFMAYLITMLISPAGAASSLASADPISASDILFALLALITALGTGYVFVKCRKLKAHKVE